MESSMKEQEEVLILAIESSCDETAAAVVKNGRTVLSNIINSQIDIHTLYGGVVPEIASRKHIENINPVINMALKEANVTLDDITAIAVTYGPGLVGALLVVEVYRVLDPVFDGKGPCMGPVLVVVAHVDVEDTRVAAALGNVGAFFVRPSADRESVQFLGCAHVDGDPVRRAGFGVTPLRKIGRAHV